MTHTREHAISILGNDATPAEIEAEIIRLNNNTLIDEVRAERNMRLAACDWRFLSDQTPSDDWINYRLNLRNMTNGLDLNNIVWPLSPQENN